MAITTIREFGIVDMWQNGIRAGRYVLRHPRWAAGLLRAVVTGRSNRGYCAVCRRRTVFVEREPWLRDFYQCVRCHSIPRQRALLHVLQDQFPKWRDYAIHESSPAGAASIVLKRDCRRYIESQFWPDVAPGVVHEGVRCENLEASTFADGSLDLVITQDVLEHVLWPDRAFADIARTLRVGGCHVFTVPIYERDQTVVRAVEQNGKINYLQPPDYHGNPIDPNGSLVVREWGRDLPDYIRQHSGLVTIVLGFRDRSLGLDGEFLHVLISRKVGPA
ncbi:MAG: class I SAM-dependent methyltransferase [Gammaproteobacteria bacterium]|nr:class I SAM-dependent methyltransferase [Gammaproteobacteria bacterium]MDH3466495.1 class I SAM-dependent methyltransferase [Gammaproteobacteria bacterium]